MEGNPEWPELELGAGRKDWIRYWVRCERHRRKEYEYRGGTDGAGFYAIESGKEGSQAFGFRGEKERRTCVVPAGLESDVHERTCVLRERYEGVRSAGRRSAWRQRRQRVVAQGVRGENGNQVFTASRFSSAGSDEREVRGVLGGQRDNGPGDRHRQQGGQGGEVQKLRHSGGTEFERSCGSAGATEGGYSVSRK